MRKGSWPVSLVTSPSAEERAALEERVTGGERPRREFRPLGKAEFATYDIFSGATIRIRFHEEGGRRAIEFLDAPEAPRARS